MTTGQTAGVSSLVAVPISVAISFITSTATVEVKADRNEKDIKEVSEIVNENAKQGVRNEERLKAIEKTIEANQKALLEQLKKNN